MSDHLCQQKGGWTNVRGHLDMNHVLPKLKGLILATMGSLLPTFYPKSCSPFSLFCFVITVWAAERSLNRVLWIKICLASHKTAELRQFQWCKNRDEATNSSWAKSPLIKGTQILEGTLLLNITAGPMVNRGGNRSFCAASTCPISLCSKVNSLFEQSA